MPRSTTYPVVPFLRILMPLIAGIVAFEFVAAPDWALYAALIGLVALGYVLRNSTAASWYMYGALFSLGLVLCSLNATRVQVPRGERIIMAFQTEQTPVVNGRWQKTQANIWAYRSENKDAEWVPVDERAWLNVDTAVRVSVADQLIVRGYLNPVDLKSNFGLLMRSRGTISSCYANERSVISCVPSDSYTISDYSALMQSWAVRHIERLGMDSVTNAVVETIVVGEKRGMDRSLRDDYSKSGVAHILSVSGLHVGFVFLIVRLLLGWIALFRRGHVLKNLLIIAAIWLYAMIAGGSAPVIRAAIMLSMFQLAQCTSVESNKYNIVFGAATIMLIVSPFQLFDVSFQLSFIAVLGILFLYGRMMKLIHVKGKLLVKVVGCLVVTVAAQLALLPLVAHNFGSIPLISLLINPVVSVTSFCLIMFTLLALVLPVPGWSQLCAWILEFAVRIQNDVVSWAANQPFAAVSDVEISTQTTIFLYAVLILLAVGVKYLEYNSQKTYSYD